MGRSSPSFGRFCYHSANRRMVQHVDHPYGKRRAFVPVFLTTFFQFMVLFLVCAACLPDEAAERDLRAFYYKNSRYLWSLVSLFQTSFLLHWIYFDKFVGITKAAARLAVYLLLVMIRSRWFHYAALVVVIAFRLYLYWSRTLAV